MEEKEIVIFGLSSGEHIICQSNVSGDGFYLVENPYQILIDVDDSGMVRSGISPYMPYASGSIGIPISTTIIGVPSQQLIDAYKTKIGAIITPPTKIIL